MPGKDFRKQLKKTFRGYTGITPKLRNSLRKLGGTLVRHGRHHILRFKRGGQSCTVVLSQTPSDHRTGMNIVTEIMHSLSAVNV